MVILFFILKMQEDSSQTVEDEIKCEKNEIKISSEKGKAYFFWQFCKNSSGKNKKKIVKFLSYMCT